MKKLLILLLFLTVKSFAQTGTPTPPLTGPISNTLYKDANGNFWGYNGNSKYFQYVPLQTGHSGAMLSTDGTYLSWVSPVGFGTVTSVSGVNTNGFTWSIANPTSTPALTLSLQNATTSLDGKLSHTDWNTFNGKQAALGFTPENIANKATTFGTLNNTLYPTTLAVSNSFASLTADNNFTGTNTFHAANINALTIAGPSLIWDNPTVTTSFGTPAQDVIMYQENGLGDTVKAISAVNAKAYFQSGLYAQLVPTSVKTSSYTAAPNDLVITNTTSSAVPITLPTAPINGTLVDVKMIIQGGTNTTTVTCGGSDVFNKSGGSTTLTLSLLNQGVLLHYNAGIWYVLADDLPLGKLVTSVTGGQGITPTTLQTGAVTFAVDTAFLHSSLSPYTGILMSYIGSGPARKWSIYVDTTLIAAKSYVNATYAPISGSANYIQNQSSGPQTSANFNIDGNGVIGGFLTVGAVSGTSTSMRVSRNMTGATTFTGFSSVGQIQSDVTSTANYNATAASTAAGSYTVSVLNHYVAQQGTFGSGSAVTTQNGFNVPSGLTGATNNRAFTGQLTAATGAWNLFMSGSAQNYLAGNLGLGSQTPNSTLMLSGNRTLNSGFTSSVGAQVSVSAGTITDNTTADGATIANVVVNSYSASPVVFTNGTSTGVTATKLSTVYIGGPPTLTAPNTATASYALDVNSGNVKMGAYGTGIAHYSSTGVLSSSTIATADIAANAVTYPKLQAVTGSSLLGNGTSGTAAKELTVSVSQGVSATFGASSLTVGLGDITPNSISTAAATFTGTIAVSTSANKAAGSATLAAGGTVTVSNTSVTANSIILLTHQATVGTIGTLSYSVSAGTSFTITSTSATDLSTIKYLIIN